MFVIVEGALVYSVYKFRAKKSAVAAQIHGNTRLEIGWTLAAAMILVVLTVVTFVKLPSIINPPNSSANGFLSASLTAPKPAERQEAHRLRHGAAVHLALHVRRRSAPTTPSIGSCPYSYQEMVVPANTTVVLVIQSTDVIHSWWVPSLGGKVDAVPGYTTYTWFKAPRASTPGHRLFHGQCAQLCGRNHAAMTALVHVISPTHYSQWLDDPEPADQRSEQPGHPAAPGTDGERKPLR